MVGNTVLQGQDGEALYGQVADMANKLKSSKNVEQGWSVLNVLHRVSTIQPYSTFAIYELSYCAGCNSCVVLLCYIVPCPALPCSALLHRVMSCLVVLCCFCLLVCPALYLTLTSNTAGGQSSGCIGRWLQTWCGEHD